MSTIPDMRRLLDALKWYEDQAKQLLLAAPSGDIEAMAARLSEDAGQCGMKTRGLYGADSATEVGMVDRPVRADARTRQQIAQITTRSMQRAGERLKERIALCRNATHFSIPQGTHVMNNAITLILPASWRLI